MQEKIKELHYEEINLDIIYDSELDIDEAYEDFMNYAKLWILADDWTYKKTNWMEQPLPSGQTNSITSNDVREMQSMLENGGRTLREVELFFKKNDEKLLPLIQQLNVEILEFSKIYEVILQVKDESFKNEHWNQIFS